MFEILVFIAETNKHVSNVVLARLAVLAISDRVVFVQFSGLNMGNAAHAKHRIIPV